MKNSLRKECLHLLLPVFLIRSFVLVLTDSINILFAIELGTLSDLALGQNILWKDIWFPIVLFVFVIIVDPLLLYLSNDIVLKKSLEMDRTLFQRILNQAVDSVESYDSGELTKRIQDDGIAYRWALIDFVCYGIEVLFLLGALIYLSVCYSVWYMMLICLLVVVGWILSYFLTKVYNHHEQEKRIADEKTFHLLSDCFDHYAESKLNQYMDWLYQRLSAFLKKINQDSYLPYKKIETIKKNSLYFYQRLTYFTIVAFGIYLVYFHQTSMGLIVMMTYLYTMLSQALTHIESILNAYHMIKRMEKRILQYTNQLLPSQNISFDSLTIDQLDFSYDEDHHFHYENIDIHRGDKVVIIGENGAGKTTLLKLICGFYPVKQGIMMNHQAYDRQSMRSCTCYIDAQALMFHENVQEYIQANHQCEDLVSMMKQYDIDDLYHENTDTLSGGERKRVDLCRVMLENKDVIILDEPEVFLDEKGKELFYQAILKTSATVIYTSHDQHLIDGASKVITINKVR